MDGFSITKSITIALAKTADDFSLDHLVTKANNSTKLSKTRIVEKIALCF
jgi:hypothetical protein